VPKVVKEYGQIQGKCFHHSTVWTNSR